MTSTAGSSSRALVNAPNGNLNESHIPWKKDPNMKKHTLLIVLCFILAQLDKLVDYPLCNDDWSGTVYVSCDAQVAESELDAQANPLFLKGCNLNIAPNTVVYVAAHNDEAFYKGCSCHTGGSPLP